MELVRIDGILWKLYAGGVTPYCPTHRLEMDPVADGNFEPKTLVCADCDRPHIIPRGINDEAQYVLRRIEAKGLKTIKILNLDDEAIPLAEAKASSKDNDSFVVALLTESRVGERLVIYAGRKGQQGKTQIFVDKEDQKLAFDPKDIHPKDVFLKVEATFADGSSAAIQKYIDKQ